MREKKSKPEYDLLEWLKRALTLLPILLAVASDVYLFVQLWRSDLRTISWIVGVTIYSVIIMAVGYVALKRDVSLIQLPNNRARRIPHFPKLYKTARYALILLAFLGIGTGLWIWQRDCVMRGKVIVLVINFDGPEIEKYRVTDKILVQLRQSLNGYDDTVIRTLNKTITKEDTVTEQQGSERARELGRSHCANLVIWGWYGVTNTDVLLTVHLENLINSKNLPLVGTKSYSIQAPVAELQSYKFQERLSTEMSAFTLFVSGIVRYEAEDYPEAINRYSVALNTTSWPEELLTKAVLFQNRGLAYLHSEKPKEAFDDLTRAIEINPRYAEAYTNRGIANSILGNNDASVTDLTEALQIKPQDSITYINRGIVYRQVGEPLKAIDDYSKAIQLDSTLADAYSNRGVVYASLGKRQEAIADCARAIQINPQEETYYSNRGFTYMLLGEYRKATADFTKAIKINPKYVMAYVNRGAAHFASGQTLKSIGDYSKAIEIAPQFSGAYYGRGTTYFFGLGEYQKAIDDFTKTVHLDPQDSDSYYSRGSAFAVLGEKQKAIDDFRKVLAISNNSDLRTKAELELRKLITE
jgi:tetratricopeptide (TPR) repeat protein